MSDKISIKGKIGFAFAGGANSLGIYFSLTLCMFFLTEIVGLNAIYVGTMLFILRIFDAVNDPIVGVLIDRTQYGTRGKSFKWIAYGGVVMAVSLIMVYSNPTIGKELQFVYYYTTFALLGISYTCNLLGTMTLMSRVTRNPLEKVSIATYNQLGYSVVGVAIAVLAVPAINFIGKSKPSNGYLGVAFIGAILIVVFSLFCAFSNCELASETRKSVNSGIGVTLKNVWVNKPFLILTIIFLCLSTGSSLSAGGIMYYIKFNLQNEGLNSVLTPLVYAGGFISCFMAYPLVKKIGKDWSLKIMLALAVISNLIRWITMDSTLTVLILMSVIFSVASNLFLLLMTPMLIDCIDYGEYMTHQREDGIIMSVSSFSQKFGMALAGFIIGIILDAYGFVEGAAMQTYKALDGIFLLNISLPTVMYMIAFVLLLFYKLSDKKMMEIKEHIDYKQSR